MVEVICLEDCIGDNGFVFKKGSHYKYVEENGTIAVIEDSHGNRNLFYQKEYKSLFKPLT